MLVDNFGNRGEYAGAPIWGSSPATDVSRNLVYIATGNLYSAPQNITDCQERQSNQSQVPPTHSDENFYDVWFFACNDLSVPDCPPGPNPDADFAEAPMMLSFYVNGIKKDIVVALQNIGFAWTLDRES
ncbi:hypothetical protein V6N13_111903 [Hibiscus sabdariffa]